MPQIQVELAQLKLSHQCMHLLTGFKLFNYQWNLSVNAGKNFQEYFWALDMADTGGHWAEGTGYNAVHQQALGWSVSGALADTSSNQVSLLGTGHLYQALSIIGQHHAAGIMGTNVHGTSLLSTGHTSRYQWALGTTGPSLLATFGTTVQWAPLGITKHAY